jgi:hypothetical protein
VSLKMFVRAPIAYVTAWGFTGSRPRSMSYDERHETASAVLALAAKLGIDTSISERVSFSKEATKVVPERSGVYHFFDGNDLVYIGKAKSLRDRLDRHRTSSHNKQLADLIRSGKAEVEWYQSPFDSWMERFELVEYREKNGRLPGFNRILGNSRW